MIYYDIVMNPELIVTRPNYFYYKTLAFFNYVAGILMFYIALNLALFLVHKMTLIDDSYK